eukprot:4705707-Amphidinium_carterae.1
MALDYAAEEFKADHEIFLEAVFQDPDAFHFVEDRQLLDSTFAPEAKQGFHILHISLLSGRSTVV